MTEGTGQANFPSIQLFLSMEAFVTVGNRKLSSRCGIDEQVLPDLTSANI